jgi:hypothetical protein
MSIETLNKAKGLDHLVAKAARHTSKRYACFTKKYLAEEFVLMRDSDDLPEIQAFYEDLPVVSHSLNPRLIFDQLAGVILDTHNATVVEQTMEIISAAEEGKIFSFPFRCSTNTWSSDKYYERTRG